ncbi:integrase, catalytic region, zinc finger, CCHC-type containing protein [Tanacetum coccineum]
MTESPLMDSGFAVPIFSPGDDPIACLNKAMDFLTAVASSRVTVQQVQGRQGQSYSGTGYSSEGNNASGQKRVVKCYNCQGEGHMARQCTQCDNRDLSSDNGKEWRIACNATSIAGCDTQPKKPRNATWYKEKAMLAKARVAGQILDEEQLAFLTDLGVSDGQAIQTIIPNTAAFQTEDLDTYDSDCNDISNAQAVLMANISNYGSDIISEANKEQNNESVTAELERYKERIKTFEQRLNIDLSSREKMIDSQMDDMIREKLALKEQVDSLEQNLSKQIKEKECLLQTFTVFKNESKDKEDKYMENEIDLEKKIKELDNILFKVGQFAQTVHMLTKPQAFYDNIHKQALGYQNPFHLKKAQRNKPTLYDGIVMSDKHVAMYVIDDEETLILEEESRSKMSEKAKDPKLPMSDPTSKPSDALPVKIEAPKELPKISLVNESRKKLKFHLAKFDNVVKIRTTPNARTDYEWGFEHTKAVFNNEIIPFLKYLKDIFNVFDRDLVYEIMEVKTVFDQMDAVVQQSSVDKQYVLLTVMNSMSLISETVNMDGKRNKSCDKCFNLEAELLKSQNAFKDLLKSHSQLEKHCISLECSIQLNQEIFQKDESCNNQKAIEILEFFENNDLKAQLQDKDILICKLKDIIKSMREKSKDENVKYDYYEIETKNVELENSVATLLLENDRMFKLDLEPLAPRLLQNREAHLEYLKYTQEQADILWGIVEQAKAEQPLDKELNFACKHAQRIQELLVYVRDTCPNAINLSAKKVAVTPKNTIKKVRFAEPLTSSSNVKQVESSKTLDSNTLVLSSTGLKCSNSLSKTTKIVESKNANHSEPNHTWGSNAIDISSSSSLVMTGQFCDGDLKVSFQKNTCFIRNLEGVDLLSGSHDTNLYTISLDEMLKTSLICLLSKASKTKSWLWHRQLSHLNFSTINKLTKDGLARGIPRLKF